MELIREYFNQYVESSEEDWQTFSSKLERVSFPKKSLLLKVGQVEKHLSFIEKGVVRYFIPGEENDLTFEFGFENEFVSAYDSFLTQQPSAYQIEALSDVVLWRLTHDDLQDVYQKTKAGPTIGRRVAEGLYIKKSKREKSLMKDTAEERYLNLLDKQPRLIMNIPLKYLASYIGITPQALSRIRKRIS